MAKEKESIDTRRFWLGATIALCGVAMLFVAMYIEPKGEISGTVLGAAGEMFVLAGSLLGLDSYVNYKIKKYIDQERKANNGDSI
ncbi:MAG: hypothetical protein IKJ78_03980 [Bacteroidales bacterium]|nr:hypothetical protein [Bacteroidales bacterium]